MLKFEIRVGTSEAATASPNGERMIALLKSVLTEARMSDLKTPSEGVA